MGKKKNAECIKVNVGVSEERHYSGRNITRKNCKKCKNISGNLREKYWIHENEMRSGSRKTLTWKKYYKEETKNIKMYP